MKSSMPGEHGWVDHGPRKTTSLDAEWAKDLGPDVRESMRRYSYDREGGVNPGSTDGLVLVERQKRSPAEEDYLDALYEAFKPALARLSAQHQMYIHGIMHAQSVRTQAEYLGIQHPAVVKGRQRALEALAKALGAEGLHDKPGIRRGLLAGTNFPLTEWLPGFTEGGKDE